MVSALRSSCVPHSTYAIFFDSVFSCSGHLPSSLTLTALFHIDSFPPRLSCPHIEPLRVHLNFTAFTWNRNFTSLASQKAPLIYPSCLFHFWRTGLLLLS